MKAAVNYQFKYEYGRKRLSVMVAVFVVCLFTLIFSSFTAASVVGLLVSAFGAMIAWGEYEQLWLYDDRIILANIRGEMKWLIHFDEIERVGLLNGMDRFSANVDGNNMPNDVTTELLIILLHDGREVQIDGNNFEEVPEINEFINQRLAER